MLIILFHRLSLFGNIEGERFALMLKWFETVRKCILILTNKSTNEDFLERLIQLLVFVHYLHLVFVHGQTCV